MSYINIILLIPFPNRINSLNHLNYFCSQMIFEAWACIDLANMLLPVSPYPLAHSQINCEVRTCHRFCIPISVF
jgi:hypothetical protein